MRMQWGGGAFVMHREEELNCVQGLSKETWRKKTFWKTQARMEK
jgi:hypothetical protein